MAEVQRGEIRRLESDGVPVFWASRPEPSFVSVLFRVGLADETLATAGITHLVEHLGLFAVGRRPYYTNGFVTPGQTAFYASGTQGELQDFVSSVGAALTELPLHRLDVEKRLLRTEAAGASIGVYARLLGHRYGASGFGLGAFREIGLDWLGEDEVAAWARERFTAGNVAVWMTSPDPPALSLGLPAGDRLPPPPTTPLPRLRLPLFVAEGSGGVAVGLVGDRTIDLTTGLSVAGERAHEALRLEHGLSYGVHGDYEPLDAERAHAGIGADCPEGRAEPVLEVLLRILGDLAERGPTAAELEEELAAFDRGSADPDTVRGPLDRAAGDELVGRPWTDPDQLRAELAAATSESIAATLARALESRIVIADEGTPLPAGHHPQGWVHDPLEGREYRAKGLLPGRDRLVVGDEGLSIPGDDTDRVTVRFDDCVLVSCTHDRSYLVLARDEAWIEVKPDDLEEGEALERHLRERIPSQLWVPAPGAEQAAAVEELARTRLTRQWMVSDELERLPGLLEQEERVLDLARGDRGRQHGLLVLTDRRFLFVFDGIRKKDVVEHRLGAISSATASRRLRDARLEVVAGDDVLSFTGVLPREAAARLAEQIGAARSEPEERDPRPSGGPGPP